VAMKKSTAQEVTCPHCHATQSEPAGMISTNCRACGKYFKLSGAGGPKSIKAPKANREVFCIKCGAPNLVASAALSTQCIKCLHYLELGDKVVRGKQTNKLYAYDDVLFDTGCSFTGMEATGRRLEIRGKVFSKLRATEEILIAGGAQVSGELHALVVRIERGAKVKVQTLECARLQVSGEVEVSGSLTATEIILSDGATFSGKLHIPGARVKVDSGVGAQFDSIQCQEIIVEGSVKLGTSLVAERVMVSASGTLVSPSFSAGSVEVKPGGSLQGRFEKYVAPEKPAEPEEPSGSREEEERVSE
jgi:cytoskeletal protein CcmA (bactofilin family)